MIVKSFSNLLMYPSILLVMCVVELDAPPTCSSQDAKNCLSSKFQHTQKSIAAQQVDGLCQQLYAVCCNGFNVHEHSVLP